MPEPARTRFRVPVELSVPRLLGAAGYAVQTSPASRRTTDLLDTADGRLAVASAELRFSPRSGWTWLRDPQGNPKLRASEWTAPASTDASVLRTWSRAYHRGSALAPRVSVVASRRTHRVRRDGGPEILTLVDERLDERAAVGPDSQVRLLRLVSSEDAAATREVLDIIADHEVPGPASTALPDPRAVDARSLFRRSTGLSLMQWMYFDCELGGGRTDALRKLRVATRRLRSDLQTFRPLLDRAWADGLRQRIGGLAHELGLVRDAEVLAARVAALGGEATRVDSAEALALQDIARSQLGAARRTLLATLEAPAYLELLDAVSVGVAEPMWGDGDLVPSVTAMARRAWARLRDFVASTRGQGDDDERLHRVRILAKRTRYAVEACVPAIGEPADASARAVAELQAVLGDHHDAAVTRAWLRAQADAATGLAYTAGELAALELGRLNAAAARWPGVWADASRKKDWRWLRS